MQFEFHELSLSNLKERLNDKIFQNTSPRILLIKSPITDLLFALAVLKFYSIGRPFAKSGDSATRGAGS